MKFHEWLNGESLFGELEQLEPESVIATIGSEQLNLFYMIQYGSRDMSPAIRNITVNEAAMMIRKIYLDKWERQAELFLNDLGAGVLEQTETITSNSESNTKDIATNDVQSVNADNDIELVETSGNVNTLNETITKTNDSTVTSTKKSLQAIQFQKTLLESTDITTTICKDVSSLLSLSIY